MNWRAKSQTIRLVEKLPLSSTVYYLLQRYVTRSIPRSAVSIDAVIAEEKRHLETYHKFAGGRWPSSIFEFGAGWDLCGAIVRHSLGVRHQQMVDLNRLASTWQINHVLAYLGLQPLRSLDDLESIGIIYSAPFDARKTGYAPSSIDLIVSTNTLEHIPPSDVAAILTECHRILAPSGIMSMQIDYSDHYSHADSRISPYNFLQFSEQEWRSHNHSFHYQSRLRHKDYVELFRSAGFRLLLDEPSVPRSGELPKLDHRFQAYTRDELLPTEGYFVLAKAS